MTIFAKPITWLHQLADDGRRSRSTRVSLSRQHSSSSADALAVGKHIIGGGARNRPRSCGGSGLKRDDFSSNRHPALAPCLGMIFSGNRYTLFGIML
jgi:hypothetical protein